MAAIRAARARAVMSVFMGSFHPVTDHRPSVRAAAHRLMGRRLRNGRCHRRCHSPVMQVTLRDDSERYLSIRQFQRLSPIEQLLTPCMAKERRQEIENEERLPRFTAPFSKRKRRKNTRRPDDREPLRPQAPARSARADLVHLPQGGPVNHSLGCDRRSRIALMFRDSRPRVNRHECRDHNNRGNDQCEFRCHVFLSSRF